MAHLRLSWLGSPDVWFGQQPLTFATRKTLALLIYLTVEAGLHRREKLAALFWPESDPAHSRGALRTTLAHLRRTLDRAGPAGSQAYLVVEADALGSNHRSDFELDVLTVTAALEAEQSGLLSEAANLYRGSFLEGFTLPDTPGFDDWLTFHREHWRHQMNTVFERLSQQQSARRDFAGGITTAVRWVAHDPLHEAAHRRLMQLHLLAGNKTAALRAYRACRATLAEELAAEPSLETQTLLERIRAQDFGFGSTKAEPESKVPPPAHQGRQNLKSLEIPFVGRAAEHTQLAAAYEVTRQGQTQMVTIEGEAGIGKTRLALEFLAWAAAQGADVLRGRTFEAGGRLPYQPLVEALRQRLERENAPDDLLSDVWLAELGRLLPELRDRYSDLPLPTPDESLARTRLLEAVARLGQALAARRPLILFLDDGQWADVASLDVLHYCGRAWTESNTPILLLLTLRSEGLATTPALGEWLSGLGRDLSLRRLALGPISADDTQELVEALAGTRPGSSAAVPPPPGFPFYAAATLKNTRRLPQINTDRLLPQMNTDEHR